MDLAGWSPSNLPVPSSDPGPCPPPSRASFLLSWGPLRMLVCVEVFLKYIFCTCGKNECVAGTLPGLGTEDALQ